MRFFLVSKVSSVLLVSSLLFQQAVFANESTWSRKTSDLSVFAGAYVAGSIITIPRLGLKFSAIYTVKSVKHSANFVMLVLENVKDGSVASVKFSAKASGKTAVVVGDSIEVSAKTSGYLLTKAGQVIAFIPNKLGQALMYHAEHQEEVR